MNKWNKEGRHHGYWEFKHFNGKVVCKYTYNNGILLGYLEAYNANSNIYCKQINI